MDPGTGRRQIHHGTVSDTVRSSQICYFVRSRCTAPRELPYFIAFLQTAACPLQTAARESVPIHHVAMRMMRCAGGVPDLCYSQFWPFIPAMCNEDSRGRDLLCSKHLIVVRT